MKIAIIGSFRKYYSEIKEIIILFQKNGIEVVSPNNSEITDSIEDFVIFASDNKKLTPVEIQTETLNKILNADMVYVFDPEGYVGRTTCYEIGVLRTTNIPLIFMEYPVDIPIAVKANEIMNPSKLIYELLHNKVTFLSQPRVVIDKNKVKNEMKVKNIVLCGSMMFYEKMKDVAMCLNIAGIPTIIPKDETAEVNNLTSEEFNLFKRKVSNQYLSKIRESTTQSILVINEKKRGLENYIGANTMVEIAMAFCWGRTIYLLNDYYEPFKDELLAWGLGALMEICVN